MYTPKVGPVESLEEQYERTLYAYDRAQRAKKAYPYNAERSLRFQLRRLKGMFEAEHHVKPHSYDDPISPADLMLSGLGLEPGYVVREFNHPTDRSLDCEEVDFDTTRLSLVYCYVSAASFAYLEDNGVTNYTEDVYLIGVDFDHIVEGLRPSRFTYVPLNGLVVLDPATAALG